MSGAEAFAILGLISSIISIVDGTKQVYDAATSAHGLPEAFREVASRLPLIENILATVQKYIRDENISEDSYKGVKHVIEACQKKAKKLEDLFRKVIPGNSASRQERYLLAVRTLGKGNKVEKLMKGILEDIQLLVSEHNIKLTTKAQQEQIARAISEVSAIPSSTLKDGLEEHSLTINSLGLDAQYNVQRKDITQGNAQQANSGGGLMHFGKY